MFTHRAKVGVICCISTSEKMEIAKREISGCEKVKTFRSLSMRTRVQAATQGFLLASLLRKDNTVNRFLESLLFRHSSSSSKAVDGVSTRDVIINAESGTRARIFTPAQGSLEETGSKFPVVVYYHGGGFALFSPTSSLFESICRQIAKSCNAMVVSVSYRLAPEFRYPVAHDDCFTSLKWLQSSSETEMFSAADLSKCFLMGDSAGGNLAHFTGCKAAETDLSPVQIKGMILVHPFFGGVERSPFEVANPNSPFLPLWMSDWFWKTYLPEEADRDHPICNVFGPNAKSIAELPLPPILVIIGSMDILQDWQARYAERLKEMNKQVEVINNDFCHGEYLMDNPCSKLVEGVRRFIQSHMI